MFTLRTAARLLSSAALALTLAACAPPAPAVAPPPPPAAPPAPPAPAPAPPVAKDDGLTRFGGIRFRLPAGWKYAEEKEMAVAHSPTGDAGFVIGAMGVERSVEVLHRADKEFGTHFPVAIGKLAAVNRLKLMLNAGMVDLPDGPARLSVMQGKGPASDYLAIFVFVKAPPGTTKNDAVFSWVESIDVDAP
jgi:hypothetical protein